MRASSETAPTVAAAGEPAWRAAVAGWLVAQAILGSLPDRAPRALDPSREGVENAFAPRILRGWPGIGEVRALAIARARWEHPDDGPPLYLSDVEGVGEATERAVRAWLEPPGAPRTVWAGRP